MPTPIKMPRLGESVAEGTIGNWLKNEGKWVERDESLAEIITDKINAELPSHVAGRLTKILVKVDETVPVGVDIALIEENADVSTSPPNEPAPGPDAAPIENPDRANVMVMENSGISDGNSSKASTRATSAHVEQRQQAPAPVGAQFNAPSSPSREPAYISPAPAPVGAQFIAPPSPASTTAEDDGIEVITPSRMRLAIAEHMVRSKRTSPHATTVVEVDMTNIAKWLEKNKEDFKKREGYSISYVPFVMKAVCEGIRKFPFMNSSWTEDNKIILKKHINLGMAVATDAGLVVPTLYDADQYTLAGLAKQISTIAQRTRANKLTIQDLQGSTFVVNNPGTFGTILSVPIINQPHAGILSMDAVVKRPVVIEDDTIAVRHMMYLCLSFDHRIMDGAGAGGFLQAVRTKLQSYGREIDVY